MPFEPSILMAGLDWPALPQQLINGLMFGAIYALIALGYTMVYGVLRLINFAHGEVFMIGAYVALFLSWQMGFYQSPGGAAPAYATSALPIILMLILSMVVCAGIGIAIERFAYRPMRNQPRIASLITAIGVSLLLQYGGALVLPVSPPRSIREEVNPYVGQASVDLIKPSAQQLSALDSATKLDKEMATKLADQVKREGVSSEFDLSAEGQKVRDARFDAADALRKAQEDAAKSRYTLAVPKGQLIMFITTVVLMMILRHLVLFTPVGRQMRAVAHDFDSAALMGINVDKIITITFVIGSALAGAGGMMCATFLGTSITTFLGVEWGIKAFVAAVLGGIGNIPGAVLGGLLIGLAENITVWAGFSQYQRAIAFVVLIAVLLFKPGGILGSAKVEKV